MISSKNVPMIDGMSIDKAHKGGGFNPFKAVEESFKDPEGFLRYGADPGGLFGSTGNEYFDQEQARADIGGFGAKPRELAKQEAAAQAVSLADARAREMEARRMASTQMPAEERAKLNINTGAGQSNLGVLGLLVEPTVDKKKSKAGLGGLDAVQAGLGFGAKGKVS